MRTLARWGLAAALVGAGVAHLTTQRREFQAQVPDWVPLPKDDVVMLSGAAEIALGAALAIFPKERTKVGAIAATFFTAIFPGNIAQLTGRRNAFGLDTDLKRAVRLLGQPLLVATALWSTRADARP
ncbi:hypothetical protein [Jatrophihabitans endophyticus]|uniref:DoxX family protein n=1 Tax=Jatrophihabitans endophyticus TaxID=1206085 RepID=UPI0019E91DE7|nr:hypothetical protein [Jatrophihabitans endophyticus]MBE7190413.1 hypothetical protein [Jatrophihabitans endophyticus]